MATRKIVPRADNEGGLGTALKRWANAFINALTADSATIGTLSDIVKAAAGVLSATTLGAANLKFFMNAAGTAPEWAAGFKLKQFTYDTATASGTQAITGIGFKPSLVFFLVVVNGTLEVSIGFDDLINFLSINYWVTGWQSHPAYSIVLYQTTEIYVLGLLSSFDADGFTINWTKTGAKTQTANIFAACFR